MASSNNVFVNAGWVEDGFFELITVVPPVLINVGIPGAPVHALPFRALGGSIADLDLLYGMLGRQATLEDIQPIFVLGTRAGLLRSFGFEIPRAAIQDVCLETFATLKEVEDIVLEANPAGANLFGSMGTSTRPMSTVRIGNEDGYWTALTLRELLLNSPAGLFIDISHTAVMPMLVGTVAGYVFDGPDIVIRYGFQSRRKMAPSVLD